MVSKRNMCGCGRGVSSLMPAVSGELDEDLVCVSGRECLCLCEAGVVYEPLETFRY